MEMIILGESGQPNPDKRDHRLSLADFHGPTYVRLERLKQVRSGGTLNNELFLEQAYERH